MTKTENCALKLTIFYLAQAFVGYCSLHQVQRNSFHLQDNVSSKVSSSPRKLVLK